MHWHEMPPTATTTTTGASATSTSTWTINECGLGGTGWSEGECVSHRSSIDRTASHNVACTEGRKDVDSRKGEWVWCRFNSRTAHSQHPHSRLARNGKESKGRLTHFVNTPPSNAIIRCTTRTCAGSLRPPARPLPSSYREGSRSPRKTTTETTHLPSVQPIHPRAGQRSCDRLMKEAQNGGGGGIGDIAAHLGCSVVVADAERDRRLVHARRASHWLCPP
ncbi:hypothetical protein B0H14DRAFT_812942 [Mycena olivaceomarginata]|nr:hypothetical protein B0H14DRAFT_812942 [Mycena olivaceomarginata]